ncbi:hydrogenase-4 component E [Candidatus Methylacidiphilum fumarolicum]|uniref:Formate hydrogenlyase membrane component n=2 Tax=Candidatus Methylacidiphilum fumarolicum TaxID=591154 RepID=I0JZE1_METFB|nr:hydrogenase-4 component E [Candidatus Methylacidiphilum fumarolicum]MBW6415783.1 hydrogenase-4 component E [Candidatus Methylacidiphilum fumarolicum]TFE66829.1 hydrogenase-4 component E [Candidatus Methylacidiphilum fumarolicum]TFE72277.1 hydrogenase-4 component E [Candidatus Methylacidiphilum fumarolicum]TFE72484.1 hydrogenase-4 component E [Candidatus Methylacidiphilum fumarolicum]TFE77658.1 hydrogenase-4 component E [Candidatus Methylacidiphilum fumarolicum]
MNHNLNFDITHMLAGSMLLVSFVLLYQDRMFSLLNVYTVHALVLAAAAAWQGFVQHAPHLYATAVIALVFKAIAIPLTLRWLIVKLAIHREIEKVVGSGISVIVGFFLTALSITVMMKASGGTDPMTREDLSFALAVVLIGLLMMAGRRNAISQVVGFMSMENGLILAAVGAKGMPLVVEISVAFSVLIALIVIGIFLFRIRERFDVVDIRGLEKSGGER